MAHNCFQSNGLAHELCTYPRSGPLLGPLSVFEILKMPPLHDFKVLGLYGCCCSAHGCGASNLKLPVQCRNIKARETPLSLVCVSFGLMSFDFNDLPTQLATYRHDVPLMH